jgi:hypothetical protein
MNGYARWVLVVALSVVLNANDDGIGVIVLGENESCAYDSKNDVWYAVTCGRIDPGLLRLGLLTKEAEPWVQFSGSLHLEA